MSASEGSSAAEPSDERLDALVLEVIAQRMHSYETLVRSGPTNLPPGVRVDRRRLEDSVERLDFAGLIDWYKDGTWLAASRAGRSRIIDLRRVELVEIDLRPDETIVLDDPVVPTTSGAADGRDDAGGGQSF